MTCIFCLANERPSSDHGDITLGTHWDPKEIKCNDHHDNISPHQPHQPTVSAHSLHFPHCLLTNIGNPLPIFLHEGLSRAVLVHSSILPLSTDIHLSISSSHLVFLPLPAYVCSCILHHCIFLHWSTALGHPPPSCKTILATWPAHAHFLALARSSAKPLPFRAN